MPRSESRLSIVQLVSSLSEWESGSAALSQDEELLDALMSVSSQARELQLQKIHFVKLEKQSESPQAPDTTPAGRTHYWSPIKHSSSMPNVSSAGGKHSRSRKANVEPVRLVRPEKGGATNDLMVSTPKPERYKRTTSDTSEASNHSLKSAISNAASLTSLLSGAASRFPYPTHGACYGYSDGSDVIYEHDRESDDGAVSRGLAASSQNLSVEETTHACLALANLCQAESGYAHKLLEKGLMNIMLELGKSSTTEVYLYIT